MTRKLEGERFAKLVAVRRIGTRSRFALWECRCDCGNTTEVTVGNWGKTETCGCGVVPPVAKTHGLSTTPEYSAWKDMVGRCTNPNFKNYESYGGRGITVCGRWLEFDNFLSDMGQRPAGLTLDRVNNDGPYSPENCRWTTVGVQCRNKRNTVNITALGRTQCSADWARELGKSPHCIRSVFKKFGNIDKFIQGVAA